MKMFIMQCLLIYPLQSTFSHATYRSIVISKMFNRQCLLIQDLGDFLFVESAQELSCHSNLFLSEQCFQKKILTMSNYSNVLDILSLQ